MERLVLWAWIEMGIICFDLIFVDFFYSLGRGLVREWILWLFASLCARRRWDRCPSLDFLFLDLLGVLVIHFFQMGRWNFCMFNVFLLWCFVWKLWAWRGKLICYLDAVWYGIEMRLRYSLCVMMIWMRLWPWSCMLFGG